MKANRRKGKRVKERGRQRLAEEWRAASEASLAVPQDPSLRALFDRRKP